MTGNLQRAKAPVRGDVVVRDSSKVDATARFCFAYLVRGASLDRGRGMRYLAIAALAAAIASGPSSAGLAADMAVKAAPMAAADPVPWTITFNDQMQYVSWTGSRGWPNTLAFSGHGAEFYNPLGVEITGSSIRNWSFDFVVRGGYVWASQTVGPFSGSVSTPTDSTFSGTATYTGFNGFQPYVTLMTNVPTGEATLTNTATFARMDPDLVPVPTFGEGFNVGPTLGVTVPVSSELTMVVNGGYTHRGHYDKEGGFDPLTMTTVGIQPTSPSDVWTTAGNVTWVHQRLTMTGSVSEAWETINYVGGVPVYRAGPRTTVAGSVGYMWDDHWTTSADGYFVHSDKNDIPNPLTGLPPLAAEMFDSNNDIFRINASQTYKTPFYNGTLNVGPVASFMDRNHNSWDPGTAQFVPAKTRESVGGTATFVVNSKLNFNARVEHVWIHENETPAVIGFPATLVPIVNGQGWALSAAMTATY
jgi:hypothetical protein